jgi:hypothetical protein
MIDLNRLRELDVQELTIRVSRYADDMKTPEAYQATAKRRTAVSGPWGVGVRATPEAATLAALEEVAAQVRDAFRKAHPDIADLYGKSAPAPSKYGF